MTKKVREPGRVNVTYRKDFENTIRPLNNKDILNALKLLSVAGKNPNVFRNYINDLNKQAVGCNNANNGGTQVNAGQQPQESKGFKL